MKKRILAFLQSIIDRHAIKQLQGKFRPYGLMFYGNEKVDRLYIPFAYFNMYIAFDIVFRKVYGARGMDRRRAIQGVNFVFFPTIDGTMVNKWGILITTYSPSLIIGKNGNLIEEMEKAYKDLFGINVQISIDEQKEWFHEEY